MAITPFFTEEEEWKEEDEEEREKRHESHASRDMGQSFVAEIILELELSRRKDNYDDVII